MAGPNPLSVLRARKAYEDFTGHKSRKSRVSKLDDNPVAGYRMGDLVGVAYEATRDGKTEQYFHKFKKAARPQLVSRHDGKQLYIDGGKYTVTDRGVEDMPHLYVVNPSRRKRRKATTRSAPKKRKTTFMANPRRRKRRVVRRGTTYRRNPVAIAAPKRRRRRSARRVSVARYRRNPSRRGGGGAGFNIGAMIIPAISVGAGAVGAELLMGYLPIPAMLKTGPVKYLTKAVIGIAGGWAIAKWGKQRKAGEALALGAIAIAAHDAIRAGLVNILPGAQFGQYMGGWESYGYPSPSMASYPHLSYYSPGMTAGMGEYTGAGEFAA